MPCRLTWSSLISLAFGEVDHEKPVDKEESVLEHVAQRRECRHRFNAQPRDRGGEAPDWDVLDFGAHTAKRQATTETTVSRGDPITASHETFAPGGQIEVSEVNASPCPSRDAQRS